ncbi:sensor domain-containing diguanylate cyclase [Shewanella japonica]|uniref:sensor domain-containing diguanylate cyclase n=1 Tax=Shewanella japonica TaxID=93973 RepID=UPI0019698DB8|nr:GGDEF domain-containing protein [Shewanella japonica]
MPKINIDSSYGVIIIQDMNAVHVDERYAQIYGYNSAKELLTSIDSFLDLLPAENHQIATQNYHDIVNGTLYPRGHTFVNIDRNGREFTVFSVDHLIEWHGRPALQVTVIDLSVLVEANKRIREKDLMYKRLITQSGQGIMVHREFKPLMVNQACVKHLHADSIEQVMSLSSLLTLIPETVQQQAKQHYQDIVNGVAVGSNSVVENICFDGIHRFFNIYDNLIEWDGEPAVQVVMEDVTEKVQLEKELAFKASHDGLTHLLNRSAVQEWLQKHIEISDQLTCVLLDIDNFKLVNDTHGHHNGDLVIQALAEIIRDAFANHSGAVGRWGGEEFIAFLPSANEQGALQTAEVIRSRFAERHFNDSTHTFSVSVSIGLAESSDCRMINDVENLIKLTDKRLYIAKSQGKNTICSEG